MLFQARRGCISKVDKLIIIVLSPFFRSLTNLGGSLVAPACPSYALANYGQ